MNYEIGDKIQLKPWNAVKDNPDFAYGIPKNMYKSLVQKELEIKLVNPVGRTYSIANKKGQAIYIPEEFIQKKIEDTFEPPKSFDILSEESVFMKASKNVRENLERAILKEIKKYGLTKKDIGKRVTVDCYSESLEVGEKKCQTWYLDGLFLFHIVRKVEFSYGETCSASISYYFSKER